MADPPQGAPPGAPPGGCGHCTLFDGIVSCSIGDCPHLERGTPVDLPLPAREYDRGEMTALLNEGAKYEGDTGYQAAIHLVTFTELPGTPEFAQYVTVDDRYSMTYGTAMRVALIGNWAALLKARRLSSTEYRFLLLAASLATGRKISLDEALANMGHAHARRICEAILIRCGAAGLYTLGTTGELARLNARNAALSAGGPDALTHLETM